MTIASATTHLRNSSGQAAHGATPARPGPTAAALAAVLLAACALAAPAAAAQGQGQRQDAAALRQSAAAFLTMQTTGLPGRVTITVNPLDSRLSLAACNDPQAFLAPGSRAWGKTTVGLRCLAPTPWTVYVQAYVAVLASYVTSAVPLAQGQSIDAGQLASAEGDLAALPAGIATEAAQVVGRSASVSLPAGMPLRLDMLKTKQVVTSGQLVRVVSHGTGFSVSAEGRAVGNASDGQTVQVRTQGGQQVSGVARAGGLVEVAF